MWREASVKVGDGGAEGSGPRRRGKNRSAATSLDKKKGRKVRGTLDRVAHHPKEEISAGTHRAWKNFAMAPAVLDREVKAEKSRLLEAW